MKTASDIDKEAAAWIVRRDASNGAAAVEREFQAWIEADVRHRVSYLRLNAAWERTALAEKLRPLDGVIDAQLLAPSPSVPRRWFWPLPVAVAAVAVLSIGLVGWFALGMGAETTYRTAVGHFERIRLDDGSTVELNTGSEIRVHMSDERRSVALVRGEAHFKVAHDATRPFQVDAGGARVRAVGTAFSVRLRANGQAEVLVTEGRVVITPPKLEPQEISTPRPTIAAGELALVEPERIDVRAVQPQAITQRLAWIEGKLVFEETTLADAVAEFNRYNRRQLVIADPQLAGLHVGGNFEATDVASFLDALERVFGIHARSESPEAVYLAAQETQ